MTITMVYGRKLYQQACLNRPDAVRALYRIDTRVWNLDINKKKYIAYLKSDSLLTPWLMVLRFRVAHQYWPISLVLFRDSFDQDDFRRLFITIKLDD
jgi:hypothetical protein